MQSSYNVARFLKKSSDDFPNNCAVKTPISHNLDGTIVYKEYSFKELDNITAAAADYFQKKGIKRGTKTLLMARPGLSLILSAFALFRIGAVPIAIDPGMGIKNFLKCVRKTKPDALVGISLALWIRRIFFSSFRSVRHSVKIDNNHFIEKLEKQVVVNSEIAHCEANDLAAILFTSGSTGAPKGVCYTHGIFDAQRDIVKNFYKIEAGEIDLPLLPIFALFNPALGITTITPEMNPAKPSNFDPGVIVQTIKQNKITNSFGSPILWGKIASYCDSHNEILPTIRRVLCAGTSVHPNTMRLLKKVLPNAIIHSPYGATENLPVADVTNEDVIDKTEQQTINGNGTCTGTILPNTRIRIIPICDDIIENFDKITIKTELDEVGEIVVSSPTTTREYYNNPEATKAAKIIDSKDGSIWHRMGDLGKIDSQGKLWFLGRKVERVETENGMLYTEACEPIFNQHPAIARCALIGIGKAPNQVPTIVLELSPEKKNISQAEKFQIIAELGELAQKHNTTALIKNFIIHPKKFPVDIRHNAKIHRLSLKKIYDKV